MSEKREELLELFDEFKHEVVKVIDDRDALEEKNEELRSARREAQEKAWAVEEKAEALQEKVEQLKTEKTNLEQELSEETEKLDELKSQLESREETRDQELEILRAERDKLQAEMEQITQKLERVSELYRETSVEKEAVQEKVDVSDLLGVYVLLLETVFYGKPHARILYTLHDIQTAINRKHLADSTGIQPAQVLKAIHDLANANLIEYDEETQEARLIKDIL
ncbi:MAG: hypothetical protein R6V83_11800 [Candidatus Thorarchaeota archaeon]